MDAVKTENIPHTAKRKTGESFNDYKYRLGDTFRGHGLSWQDVCNLLNAEGNLDYGESKWRKELQAVERYKVHVERSEGEVTKILSLSDLHIPFQTDLDFLYNYTKKIDILVFNGDVCDCQSISKFQKKYRYDFVDELILSRQIMMDIIDLIQPKKVVINYGNHEARLVSYLSDRVHPDVLQLMPQTAMDLICDFGFTKHNHADKSHTFYTPIKDNYDDIEIEYTKNWYCKIGGTVLAHPKACSSSILSTASKALMYFYKQGLTDIDAVVLAHTHKLGMYRDGAAWIVEQGCLCKDAEYTTDGNLTTPHSRGCAYISQDAEGKYVFDKSHLVWL